MQEKCRPRLHTFLKRQSKHQYWPVLSKGHWKKNEIWRNSLLLNALRYFTLLKLVQRQYVILCVRAFVPYLADFGWCKNHVEDARPASNHSCGDCIGQCYHQEPQIAERDIKHVNHKKTNYIILYIIQPPDRNFSTFVESINVILGKRKRFETKSVYSMY